ncbi:MAG: cache domain-containing protein [Bacteroidetes bacterium]|nr:cache domain-containing protein [Bacteroidota bacterium]
MESQQKKSVSKKLAGYTAIFLTILILGAFICFYLWYYVSNNESKINNRQFRTLERIAHNMNQRIPDFSKLAKIRIAEADSKFGINETNNSQLRQFLTQNSKGVFDLIRFSENYFVGKEKFTATHKFESHKYIDSTYVLDLDHETYVVFRQATNGDGKSAIELGIKVSHYLPRLLKYDFFTNYTLIKNNKVVYSDFSQRIDTLGVDSLLDKVSAFKSKSIRKVKFSGENYTLFTIPFSMFNRDIYTLTGLIPTQKITSEKMSVSDSYVFALLFLLLGVAVAFPFLKIYLMSPLEKMKSIDILLSMFSLTMGAGLFFYALFSQYQYRFIDKVKYDNLQIDLSQKIESSFINDLAKTIDQLKALDSSLSTNPYDITNVMSDSIVKHINTEKILVPNNLDTGYKNFKLAFWLDPSGRDVIKWVNDSILPASGDYSDRDYFIKGQKGAFWSLSNKRVQPFVIQPVRSWTDGEFRAVVAIKSKVTEIISKTNVGKTSEIELAAISSRLPSVISAILPDAFNFCIVDKKGEVWFHSDINRCLNENILEECNNNPNLASAIDLRTSMFFDETYSGALSRVRVEPIDGLPLYLVTIRDKSPLMVKNIKIFVVTLFFLVVILLMVGLQIAILLMFNIRNSKLKANQLRLDWLWPDKKKSEIYGRFSIFNLGMAVLTIFILTWPKPSFQYPLLSFYMIFFNIYATLTAYYFVCHYQFLTSISDEGTYKKTACIYVSGAILLFGIVTLFYSSNSSKLVAAIYSAGVLFSAFYLFKDFIREDQQEADNSKDKQLVSENRLLKGFTTMLLTWITLASLLPVYCFFVLSHNVEAEIIGRQHQLAWINGINNYTNKDSELINGYHKFEFNRKDGITNIYLEAKYYQTTLTDSIPDIKDEDMEDECSSSQAFIVRLNDLFHFNFNAACSRENMLSRFELQDTLTYKWINKDWNTLKLISKDAKASHEDNGDNLYLETKIPLYHFPLGTNDSGIIKGLLFWITILFFFCVLFLVARYFIRKIFLPDYLNDDHGKEKGYLEQLSNFNPGNSEFDMGIRIFVVSLPHSGKNKYFREEEHFKNFNKVFIDFAKISDEESWNEEKNKINTANPSDLIICYHFETNLSDLTTTNLKLYTLELMFRKKLKNIVLISTIHPATYLNYVSKMEEEVEGLTTDIAQLINDQNYYLWSSLLSSFEVIYYPLKREISNYNDTTKVFEGILENECNHGLYLKNLKAQKVIINSYNNQDLSLEEREEIYLKIQTLSYTYYLSLWNSLTREEQYLLYDLAEDGLVNYKNFDSLTKLYLKGLIIKDGSLHVMNRSFRNFILTEVKKGSPILNDKNRAKDSDWNKFKIPFYIIFIAVMFFLFYTQQDSFNTLTTVLGGFTASFPLILKLWNMISLGKES